MAIQYHLTERGPNFSISVGDSVKLGHGYRKKGIKWRVIEEGGKWKRFKTITKGNLFKIDRQSRTS